MQHSFQIHLKRSQFDIKVQLELELEWVLELNQIMEQMDYMMDMLTLISKYNFPLHLMWILQRKRLNYWYLEDSFLLHLNNIHLGKLVLFLL